ncbi:MAG TPA: class I SAM-dependent methyltransferase [Candidatus Baltobacteraceae bacterium]|jgi:2-polyprenyl-3-methyl-5-hydroxy-6-metoxy-1,4-benzoquinol methylase|nr:class I SAM-dependent methyltransferase [Candidatus Baltobacteraceae bacterium]
MPADTDHDWEILANQDPYWAVLTQDRFRTKAMDDTARRDFFLSGEKYVDWVFTMIRDHIDSQFNPATGLDFGCGVGRLILPMSRRCRTAVGIDVSDAMLQEAQRNCRAEKVENVSLVKGDDKCAGLEHGFDFINSFIVFQHIPCDRGIGLFRRLVELLNDSGVAAIHITYSRSQSPVMADAASYDPQKKESPRGARSHLAALGRAVRNRLARMFQGRTVASDSHPETANASTPVMQMNSYSLNPLFQILQHAGVREIHAALSDHDGSFGTVLFFKKGPGLYAFPALKT